jgi:MFS family permease
VAIQSTTKAIDSTPNDRLTGYLLLVFVLCGLGYLFDVIEGLWFNVTIPIWLEEFDMSLSQMGFIATVAGWVGVLGGVGFPLLADRFGRKPMMNFSILGFTIGTALTGFVRNPLQLGIARSLTRIPLAGETIISYMMVAETMPTRWRSIFLAGTNSFYPLGYALGVSIAAAAIAAFTWRGLYFLGIVPALMVVVLRFKLKESPRFEHVKQERAAGRTRQEGVAASLMAPWRLYPRQMRISLLTFTLYTFIWIGWSTWMPTWLVKVIKLDLGTAAQWQAIWMICSIAGYWVCAAVCQRIGKKRGVPLFIVPGGILLIVAMNSWDLSTTFFVGLVLNILVTASYGSGSNTYCTELFPTQIRGAALGWISLVGTLVGYACPWAMGLIGDALGLQTSFILPAIACLLVGPVFLFIAPETVNVPLPEDVVLKTPVLPEPAGVVALAVDM